MRILCTLCGTSFSCDSGGDCWCARLPHLLRVPADAAEGCLCLGCLAKKLEIAHEQQKNPTA